MVGRQSVWCGRHMRSTQHRVYTKKTERVRLQMQAIEIKFLAKDRKSYEVWQSGNFAT